ncbi:transglutaminase-like domain-containing protein [uncultured Acetobacteroides sp.]|uniref:transglutaminase-like domain-containing protein n=1 Tax=uncultured Acetobacteroides sp. TaxID=1760811 RepID=UPI0029F4DE65|nr:transglutaminase-like domain-containing protein [uncultured Acetobacteroides sp.]
MKIKFGLTILVVLVGAVALTQLVFAEEKLPVIRANSTKVSIRDGYAFWKSYWNVDPEVKPNVYTTSRKYEESMFSTDLESISFTVKPNKPYRFIILLNGKDSVLTEIAYVPSYLETLKRAAKYNVNDGRIIPKFTYQSAENPNLQSLRKHYKLDSIAGKGSEFSQVVKVLSWLHNLVPHDGMHRNPEKMNAESMISVCKSEKRGLNCRGLAITLNECYLSLGFKSRYVTCLPKDSLKIDTDCHVINMVYLNSLKKWIWIDPTNNAYVMNEKGVPLSIEEVRQRIIENKPLEVNKEANWNNKTRVVKEEYLFSYMAKNLYMLECPVVSEYDIETPKQNKFPDRAKSAEYIKLIPVDYFVQKPDKQGNSYITNNSKLFWAKP